MKKNVSFLFLFLLTTSIAEGQIPDKLFKKYADVEQFEYTSIGKGILSFLTLFTDYTELSEGMMKKISGIEILLLEKDGSNAELFSEFQTEIDKIILSGEFEITSENRTKNDSTYIYKRINKRSNIELLIFTSDYQGTALIWIKGKANPNMLHEKESVRNKKK
ncbi:MAG: DUF4252 domain-containing protein [Paludibacteraceae bacterium]